MTRRRHRRLRRLVNRAARKWALADKRGGWSVAPASALLWRKELVWRIGQTPPALDERTTRRLSR